MDEYYKIKDTCRKGLIKYLQNAISFIPVEGEFRILDIGCGTGVPTIFMSEHFSGSILAIDTDKPSLEFFQNGFPRVAELLKPGGYFVIHDEYRDHERKTKFVAQHFCRLINSWYLDETIWWNEYYSSLNNRIKEITDTELSGLFKGDISEVESYKTDPAQFRSIYYLVQKKI